MRTTFRIPIICTSLGLLLASCASMRDTASVRDDVYYLPSREPAVAAAPVQPRSSQSPAQQDQVADDYYDQRTSRDLGTDRNYYDMAYNDPYYYNYGRFGFGSGMGMMGWQTGWAGPGWGMGMGYGTGWGGPGMGSGWNMSLGYGLGGGYYDPWYGGWGYPYHMNAWNRPWGMAPWRDPWMGGYGWGNYYGPYGNCYACYAPVVVGGSSGVSVGHRPSLSGGGGSSGAGTVHQPRSAVFRDPVGLTPSTRMDDVPGIGRSTYERDRSFNAPRPQQDNSRIRGFEQRGGGSQRDGGLQRGGSFDRGGGIDRGGTPSRSGGSSGGGGGGGRTITSPRPR